VWCKVKKLAAIRVASSEQRATSNVIRANELCDLSLPRQNGARERYLWIARDILKKHTIEMFTS
jgi:hypothetical protein